MSAEPTPIVPVKVGELAPGETNKVFLGMLGALAGVLVFSVWHADRYWKPKR
jgi:hypothetical protein